MARSYITLFIALAQRGPGFPPPSGITTCQVGALSGKFFIAPAKTTPMSSSQSMVLPESQK